MNFLPENIDSKEIIQHLRGICLQVSNIMKSYKNENGSFSEFKYKLNIKESKKGPVTNVDLEVSNLIINSIKNNYPNIDWAFLSEENYDLDSKKYFEKDWVWIIDPLDGTKDFINQTGEYAMHLSLAYRKKTVLGIVLIPTKDEVWFYLQGLGTWLERKGNHISIKVNNRQENLSHMRILASKNHRDSDFELFLKKINPYKIIGMGSVGYKITNLIKGKAEIYISYAKKGGPAPKDWDMAAPEAVLKGLGGSLTYIDGDEIEFLKDKNFLQDGIIIGSLSKRHQELCDQIRKLTE